MERYNVPETPYIGIIDPRTGSLVKCFSGSKGVPSSAGTMVERCKCLLMLMY